MRIMTFILIGALIGLGVLLYLIFTGQLTSLLGFDLPDWPDRRSYRR